MISHTVWALLMLGAALVALPIACQLIVAAPLYLWRSRYGELSLDKYLRVELGPRRRFEMRAGEPQTNA
jgi:hypothetical protein